MTADKAPLIAALAPLTSRVRTDVTAIKRAEGGQVWTRDALTEERLAQHLNGGPARGVSPIKAGESVTMVALLDFDSHRGEVEWGEMAATAAHVYATLELAWGCTPVAFRSSGGAGVHLYLLWAEPQEAKAVRRWLAHVLDSCGLKSGTGGLRTGEVEVFPRQDRVRPEGFGNQFILPLAGKSEWLTYDDLADSLLPAAEPLHALAWRDSLPVDAEWGQKEAGPKAGEDEEESPPGRSTGSGILPQDWPTLVWAPLDAIPNGMEGAKLGEGEGLAYDRWLHLVYAVHWATGGAAEGLERVEAWSARSLKYQPGFAQAKVWGPASASDRTAGEGLVTAEVLWAEAQRHGWVNPRTVDAFPQLVEHRPSPGPAGAGEGTPPPERRGVPLAKHLATDQANANRVVRAFGERLLVAAGRWYTWDGRVWRADEADVYRFACQLSQIVRDEARAWQAKAEAQFEEESGE